MLFKTNNTIPQNLHEIYVHRDCFYSFCDFCYTHQEDSWSPSIKLKSKRTPAHINDIRDANTIFVSPWGIEQFLREEHHKIKSSYILITPFYGPVSTVSKYINDPKIIAWFGSSNRDAITFDKFTLIPLGMLPTTSYLFDDKKLFEFIKSQNVTKTSLLYMNFYIHDSKTANNALERMHVTSLFYNKSYCTHVVPTVSWRKPFVEYINEAAKHKFILSPEGDMQDCYRHWESLVIGSIPVMRTNSIDPLFKDLPVLIVDDWSIINEQFLHDKYEEIISKKYNYSKLYMNYWYNKIKEKQHGY